MPRFRPIHCGYERSMEQVQRIETFSDLLQIVSQRVGRKVNPEEVRTDHFGRDPRNGWDTWAVILVDHGPLGFTNACLDPNFHPSQSQFSELGAL